MMAIIHFFQYLERHSRDTHFFFNFDFVGTLNHERLRDRLISLKSVTLSDVTFLFDLLWQASYLALLSLPEEFQFDWKIGIVCWLKLVIKLFCEQHNVLLF